MSNDNLKIEAEVDLNTQKAINALNDLVTKMGNLRRTGPESAKAIDAVERSATKMAASLAAGTTSIRKQTQALKELHAAARLAGLKDPGGSISQRLSSVIRTDDQAKALQAQERSYQSYFRNIEAAQKNSLARQQQAAYQTYATNMPKALQVAQRAAYDSYASNISHTKSVEANNRALANQRYALYDVASSFAVVSAATLGAAAAAVVVGISYEKAFAAVERTSQATGKQLSNLRAELIQLSTEVPLAFEEISNIAALGGQLGIDPSGLDEFTSVVAKLVATTNLSAEAAGTALGRFDALFEEIDPSNFEALGSSILKVGVNSVATETQIVNTAVQISSMGDFAGLTAEQVVGLSGALASVGAQPELARGTVTRVFTQMSTAISAGGDSLNEFARLSGVSADEFKAAWGTDKFASVFQGFLRGVERDGQGAIATLNDLGISSVRDVPLLLRLAGAQNVVRQAFADSKSGFNDASELNKQYEITLHTVAAQLTIFGNTLKGVLDAIGGAALGPLSGILSVFQGLAQGLLTLAGTGVGKVIGVTVLALTGLVGVLTGLRAIQALSIASAYAFTTAHESLGAAGLKSASSIGGIAKQMALYTIGTTRATAATVAYEVALERTGSKFSAVGAGIAGATTKLNGFKGAMTSALVGGGWLAAIGLGIQLLSSFAQQNQVTQTSIEAVTQSLDEQTGALTQNTTATTAARLEASGFLAAGQQIGLSADVVTQAVLGQKDAIEQVRAAIEATYAANDEAISTQDGYSRAVLDATNAADTLSRGLDAQIGITEEGRARWERLNEAVGDTSGLEQQIDAGEDLASVLKDVLDTQYELVGGTVAVQNAIYGLGSSLGENGADFSAYSVAGRENLAALQGALSAMVTASGGDANALATMIAGLMQTLASYGVDTVNQLAFVQNALAQLTGGKGVGGLTGVTQAAGQASNALGQGFSAGANKAAKAARSAGKGSKEAAKEIKTLSDYVNELSGVFKTAFDIRFGLEQSLDEVSNGWQKMRESADNAREAISDATQELVQSDATIQGLNAANNTLTYQLTVAQQYGDVLRATEIMAEIAKNNADISDEQKARTKTEKELAKAQAAATPILDGQTEASRDQRDMVLGLVKSYQDQVAALANSGLSQQEVARRTQELKQQFINQLIQMGYNRAEVERYAASFDDLTQAILRVPRNITVNADTSPAQRAIEEFLAKNANRTANVGTNLSVPDAGSTYGLGASAGAAYADGWNDQMKAKRRLTVQEDGSVPGGKRYSTDGGQTWFLQKGGKVGSGAQYHSAGGVHGMHPGSPKGTDTTAAWLTPGEFVQRTAAVDYYGLPFMNALNNMQIPKYLSAGGPATGRSGGGGAPTIQLVELLPNQISQIVNGLAVVLSVDGKVIGDAANNANYTSARRGTN